MVPQANQRYNTEQQKSESKVEDNMKKYNAKKSAGEPTTLLLTRSDLSPLLTSHDYIKGIEYAFRQYGEGHSFGNSMIHGDTPSDLEFHIKAGGLLWKGKPYFALKANGSSFQNRKLRGLPNILGVIILFDGESGFPLAIMESTELTRQRTAAGTVVALKFLAPADTRRLLLCGCGLQGRTHMEYLKEVLPLDEVFVYDLQRDVGLEFAQKMELKLGIPVHFVPDVLPEASRCKLIVTCTPSKTPYLKASDIRAGTTIAAVGADSPDKQELDPHLLKRNKVVVDILSQCTAAGELHHAILAGLVTEEDIHAEIGDVVAGKKPGRETADEVIIYKATGTAIQDTAAAIMVYEKATASNVGLPIDLFA